ncbi:hypothetical protein ACGFK1_00780 [Mycobacterium sp. NPDC048908]|uniref:hypothetical protein n=1 Tax=Mycobacterium sp. NPDC048908 TaxID=3364292 RepID=UPI003723531F
MTTHDEQLNPTTSAPTDQPSSQISGADPSSAQPGAMTASAESPQQPSVEPQPSAGGTENSTGGSLFAENDRSGLRTRWDDVQAGFVDDPKDCVQKADALVADVVQQLTTGFSEARSRLEAQWARGEDASTEDLRQALKRYREFFERLLAV